MPTSIELLPSIAPEIDASTPQSVALLALAELEVGISLDEPLRPYIVAYKAAHIITLANRGGASGEVQALREGALSIVYSASGSGGMSSTSYGEKYLDLIKQLYGMVGRTGVMPSGL